jgi:hypothetical protein
MAISDETLQSSLREVQTFVKRLPVNDAICDDIISNAALLITERRDQIEHYEPDEAVRWARGISSSSHAQPDAENSGAPQHGNDSETQTNNNTRSISSNKPPKTNKLRCSPQCSARLPNSTVNSSSAKSGTATIAKHSPNNTASVLTLSIFI